jgi:hypothetical protein
MKCKIRDGLFDGLARSRRTDLRRALWRKALVEVEALCFSSCCERVPEREREREREKFFKRNSFFSCMLFYHFETFQKSALRFGPGLLFCRSAFLFFYRVEEDRKESISNNNNRL